MRKLEIPRRSWGNGRVTTVALSPSAEVFQVNAKVQRRLRNCKRRIRRRLRQKQWQRRKGDSVNYPGSPGWPDPGTGEGTVLPGRVGG
jgi:hypothetical protein